jgi:glycosyltransferase involved in cell wall biosynthesis
MALKIKILFFIESLHYGGKERLVVELLSYLKKHNEYELMLVLIKKDIQYTDFLNLRIPYEVIERKWSKKDPGLFIKFYNISKNFQPDIIHTFGSMSTFYSLPTVMLRNTPLINSQISDAPPRIKKWSFFYFMSRINFRFSKLIVSNSQAGLKSYKIENKKGKVIYNGISLDRFGRLRNKEEMKEIYGIKTPYIIIMVATFSDNKDYDKYINIAKKLNSLRRDVTFVSVGDGSHFERIKNRVDNEKIPNIIFTGRISDVESLISACDIGTLFSPNGEGISCAITEYMALGKPVIANDAGGTKEIVKNEINGYLITEETAEEIAELINNLIDDNNRRQVMGEAGRNLIHESFTIDRMGKEFEKVYGEIFLSAQK